VLTDVQRQKLTHLFDVMDSDDDGFVEWEDYERIAKKISSQRNYQPGSAEYEGLMGQYRYGWQQAAPFADERGMNLEKWLAYSDAMLTMPGIYDMLVRRTAGMIFDTFDQDGDQKVSVKEWREFFRCYSIDPAEADRCWEKYDLNGDGYVSRSEIVDLFGQFYLSSDPSAPGSYLFGRYDA
jgi:hypothetical protein